CRARPQRRVLPSTCLPYPPLFRSSPAAPSLRICSASHAASMPSTSKSTARTVLFNHGLWSEWRPACAASPIVPSLVLSRFGQRVFTSLRKSSMAFASRQLMRHPPVGQCPPVHRHPRPRTPTGRSGPLRPPSWRAALRPGTVSCFLRIVGQAHTCWYRHLCIVFPVPSLVGLKHDHEVTRILALNQINVLDARPLRPLRTTLTALTRWPLRTTLTALTRWP